MGSIDARKITSRLDSNSVVGRAHLLLIPQFAHELGAGVKVLVFVWGGLSYSPPDNCTEWDFAKEWKGRGA